MKKLLLAILALPLVIASCKKSDSTSEIYKPSYHVDGISDRIIQKNITGLPTTVTQYLTITYENQEQERVTLSLENLPAGLTAKFTPATGFPTFSTQLTLIDSGVATGEYTLNLIATGASSGKKTFPFNLSVLPVPDCSNQIIGAGYISQLSCGAGTFMQNVTSVSGSPGRVNFSNFDNTGAQVYGLINCTSNQINIPTQSVNGATYNGSGYFYQQGAQRVVNISFYRSSSSGSTSCTLSLTL